MVAEVQWDQKILSYHKDKDRIELNFLNKDTYFGKVEYIYIWHTTKRGILMSHPDLVIL